MDYQPAELADRLRKEGEAVQVFYQQIRPDQWEVKVYSEQAAWHARDLLAHFIAAEQGFQQIIQSVAGGGPSVEPGFDIDAYNERTVNELRKFENLVLLGQFAMVRERTVVLVRNLSLTQLQMRGQHPSLGETSIAEMIRLIYHHNTLHLRDVRKALRAGGVSRTTASGAAG